MDRIRDNLAGAGAPSGSDLDALLHPSRVFTHPNAVVGDPSLTLYEKRAILSSWASDACTVEAAPTLREMPGSGQAVSFDEVMVALQELDRELVARTAPPTQPRKGPRRWIKSWGRSGNGGVGSPQPAM